MTDILQKLDAVEQTLNECAFTCDSDAVGYIPAIRAALEAAYPQPCAKCGTNPPYHRLDCLLPTPPKGGSDGHN